MKFEALDIKREDGATCHLIKSSLSEYLSSLPEDYASYDVQRAIVGNSYLDKLVLTILNKRHIPSITLVLEDGTDLQTGNIENFKILDGLQRTHRLKIINDTKDLLLQKISLDPDQLSEFQLKRKYRNELVSIGSSSYILIELKRFHDLYGSAALENCFTENYQWFEAWSGLSASEQVQKMLLLNAGHKPVNIRHQLELLFNNTYSMLTEVKTGHIKISREKEISSASHSKQRNVGEFHFSHLISSMISYSEGKPISTNSNFIESIQNDKEKYSELTEAFTYEFLESFVRALYEIDSAAEKNFGYEGVQWMGRDTSLSGMFAALGAKSETPEQFITICKQLVQNFRNCDIPNYEAARKNIDLAKINIGAVSKRVIFKSFTSLIEGNFSTPINWHSAFDGVYA
ncbi:hypothetical protein [Pseudomonas boanensis]|uniref:hypothetical protein n=1 Tax=Metapseudomonas boanensis TaxID=2822138 RepID=UPI0035D4A761